MGPQVNKRSGTKNKTKRRPPGKKKKIEFTFSAAVSFNKNKKKETPRWRRGETKNENVQYNVSPLQIFLLLSFPFFSYSWKKIHTSTRLGH